MAASNQQRRSWLDHPITNADVERLTHKLHAAGLVHTCLTCDHFDEKSEGCLAAGGARPPARTIAYGCAAWSSDVPF